MNDKRYAILDDGKHFWVVQVDLSDLICMTFVKKARFNSKSKALDYITSKRFTQYAIDQGWTTR